MDRKTIIKLILGVIVVLLVCNCVQFSYGFYDRTMKQKNHEAIEVFINDEVTYEADQLDEQMAMIEDWLNNRHISDGDRGHLYERMSLVYKNRGDNANMYRAIGYALYYLDKSDELSYAVNIYLDQVNFYIVNFNYELATEELEKAKNICDFDDIERLEVRSYAYRLEAIIDEYYGRLEKAEENLLKSKEIINQSTTGIYEEPYRAMIDANLAKVYIGQERYEEAQAIIDYHEGSELFTQDIYREVLVRDFIIPYYEAKCVLAAKSLSNDEIKEVIDEFIDYCQSYGYEKNELNLLLYLMKNVPSEDPEKNEEVYQIINETYEKAMNNESQYATTLVNGQVESSIEAMAREQREKDKEWSRVQAIIMYVMFVALLCIVIIAITQNAQKDGLTKIGNRKAFNRVVDKLKKSQDLYALIMIDIDDFKHVNDTYGHQKGDEVLIELSKILSDIENKTVIPYRYGGEEFVVVLTRSSVSAVEVFAEQIRSLFEKKIWDFGDSVTVSIGAAVGSGKADVLKEADDNLYKSKNNGKNQVTF